MYCYVTCVLLFQVPLEDEYSVTDGDEDLDTAFTTVQEKTNNELLAV